MSGARLGFFSGAQSMGRGVREIRVICVGCNADGLGDIFW